jgi:YfiH family protein
MAISPASAGAIEALNELLSGVGLEQARRGGRNVTSGRPAASPPLTREQIAQAKPRRPITKSRLEVVRVPGWEELPWLVHGFSTRTGGRSKVYRPAQRAGELNLVFSEADDPEVVAANRRLFLMAIARAERAGHRRPAGPRREAELPGLVTLKQIHSSVMHRVGRSDVAERPRRKGDGLMTDEPGVVLAMQTADCIPVLIADRRRRAVAAFHAGWRGTLKRIVQNGVGRMRLEFGSRPGDLVAAVGPGIGLCCYAVGEEVRSEFESQFAYAADLFREVSDADPVKEKYPLLFLTARAPGHGPAGSKLHLDLVEANRRQLLDAGLGEGAIHVVGDCTSCRNERYFSHRADRGFTGRMLSAIGIRE